MAINLAPPPRQEQDINTWQWKEWLFALYQKVTDFGDKSTAGVLTITPSSNGDITLDTEQNASSVRVLETGSWTSGHSLIGDDVDRQFVVINNSGFAATTTTSGTTPTTYEVPSDGLPYTLQSRAGVGVELIGNDVPETGTFDASITFGGASTGITYDRRVCYYTKRYIGNGVSQVTVNGSVRLTSKGTSTGIARIAGMPFSAYINGDVDAKYFSSASFWMEDCIFSGMIAGYAESSVIRPVEIEEATGSSSFTDSNFTDNSSIIFFCMYLTQD